MFSIYHTQELTTNQNKWLNHYKKLCEKGQERAQNKKDANKILGYSEKHHIIPKCMGGLDINENFVFLSAEEHFIAHQLLVKIFPFVKGLVFACMLMSRHNTTSSKAYSWIKKAQSKARIGQNKHNNESVRKMAKKLTGRTKETHPYIAIQSKKAGEKLKGRNKHNNEGIKIMSEKLKGVKKKPESVILSAKNRNKLNEEQKRILITMRNNGIGFNPIHDHFIKDLHIKISKSALQKIYHREKHLF